MKHKTMKAMMTELNYHCGTTQYFNQILNRNSVYTEGAKAYFEFGAYWLYDIIQTEVWDKLKKLQPDTYYFTLQVKDDNTAKMFLKDWQEQLLWEREIPFTDHPHGEMKLFIAYDGMKIITYLPSEH